MHGSVVKYPKKFCKLHKPATECSAGKGEKVKAVPVLH